MTSTAPRVLAGCLATAAGQEIVMEAWSHQRSFFFPLVNSIVEVKLICANILNQTFDLQIPIDAQQLKNRNYCNLITSITVLKVD